MSGNPPQALLRLLVAVAHADGSVSDSERAMLLKLADELDGTLSAMLAAEIETPAHLEDIVSDLVELNAPRFVLTLALRIAYADGDYSTSERSLIHSLAQHLGAASIVSAVEQDVHGEFASATIGSR